MIWAVTGEFIVSFHYGIGADTRLGFDGIGVPGFFSARNGVVSG